MTRIREEDQWLPVTAKTGWDDWSVIKLWITMTRTQSLCHVTPVNVLRTANVPMCSTIGKFLPNRFKLRFEQVSANVMFYIIVYTGKTGLSLSYASWKYCCWRMLNLNKTFLSFSRTQVRVLSPFTTLLPMCRHTVIKIMWLKLTR